MDIKDKKITVIGIGESGKSAAIFLKAKGALVYATDLSNSPEVKNSSHELKKLRVNVETGKHSEDFIKNSESIIVSPGVPPQSPPVKWAKKYNIEMISEIELAFRFCKGRIIAVTGTNGKSTTVTLIRQILKNASFNAVLCGNVGDAFIKHISQISKDSIVVLEVSSFQLENIKTFKPYASVILNISQNHLDRHDDLKEYFAAKQRIYEYQNKDDYVVLNYDDINLRNLKSEIRSNVLFFSRLKKVKGAYVKDDKLFLNIKKLELISDIKNFKLKQPHNIENFLASSICAAICGAPIDVIKNTIANFKGLPHRIQLIASINGVDFIDDSKSTTVDSTKAALRSMEGKVILIAGGRNKGSNFRLASKEIRQKVKAMILIGEARGKMREELTGFTNLEEAKDMDEAVAIASKIAKKGESVLLSPMCASFDMFKDYKHRGDVFKAAVEKISRLSLDKLK